MSTDPVIFAIQVFAVVAVLAFVCFFLVRSVRRGQPEAKHEIPAKENNAIPSAPPVPATVQTENAVIPDDDIPAEHIAAIAAAIHYLSKKVAILRIEDNGRRTAWVAEGRAVHHASHNPIRKR